MKENYCKICDFKTTLKSNFIRHLNTKKHKNNEKEYHANIENYSFSPQKSSKILISSSKNPQFSSKNLKNPQKSSQILPNSADKLFICQFCNKVFKRSDNLNRHIKKSCKVKKEQDEIKHDSLVMQLEENKKEMEEHKAEKDKLYKYIDKLIDKTGTTNTNITIDKHTSNQLNNQTNNQIKLNNFGEENLSHITDDYKLKMLSLPYGMIQNMIEKVHFNKKHHENKNIALTNKRENMIRVFRGKRWRYQDREYVVDELIKNHYNRLDEYFEEIGKDKMNATHNRRYLNFQKKFDRQDDELMGRIKRETEMILLSENLQK